MKALLDNSAFAGVMESIPPSHIIMNENELKLISV